MLNLHQIAEILFWLFLSIGIVLFILLIVGYYPTIQHIFIALISGFLIKLYDNDLKIWGKLERHDEKFESIIRILKNHDRRLRGLESRLGKIESKIS